MDKEKLSKLRHIQGELEMLKRQITELETGGFYADGKKPRTVTDTVHGSSPHHPYELRTFTIKGYDQDGYGRKLGRLRQLLQRRANELADQLIGAYRFIDSVDDSLIRQIIILRHVRGMTWAQVAETIGGRNTPDSVRMIHDRFFRDE